MLTKIMLDKCKVVDRNLSNSYVSSGERMFPNQSSTKARNAPKSASISLRHGKNMKPVMQSDMFQAYTGHF